MGTKVVEGLAMRVLIHHLNTDEYLASDGRWRPAGMAMVFGRVYDAISYLFQHSAEKAEIVVDFGPEKEVHIPVDFNE